MNAEGFERNPLFLNKFSQNYIDNNKIAISILDVTNKDEKTAQKRVDNRAVK